MPLAPARPCRSRKGCTTTTRDGWCDACRPVMRKAQDDSEARRESHRFLARKAWRQGTRAAVLERDPVCVRCKSRFSTIGAHKIPRERCEKVMAAMLALPEGSHDGVRIAAINRALTPGFKVVQDLHPTNRAEHNRPDCPPTTLAFQSLKDKAWRPLFLKPLALIAQGWDLRLDIDNVEGVCKPCHDLESGGQGAAKRGLPWR